MLSVWVTAVPTGVLDGKRVSVPGQVSSPSPTNPRAMSPLNSKESCTRLFWLDHWLTARLRNLVVVLPLYFRGQ